MQDLGEDRVFYSPIYCNLRMYFVFPPLKNISAVLFYLGVFTFCTCCIKYHSIVLKDIYM